MINRINNKLDDQVINAVLDTAISICATDFEGRIVQTNLKFNQILGYENGELNGIEFFRLLPNENQQLEKDLDEKFWENREAYSSVYKLQCSDGTYLDVEASYTFVENADNPLKVATFSDVTELALLNELMNKVGKQTKVGGWQRNLKSESIIWTDGVFHIYEIPVGEIPRFGDADLHAFFPDGGLNKIIDSHDYTIRTGEKSEVITRFVSATGRKKWVRNVTEVQYVNGCAVKLYGTFQDITEEKERELLLNESKIHYNFLFDNNPNPLLLIEQSGEYLIQDVNRAAESLYGYTREEFIGMSAKQLRHPKDLDYFINVMNNNLGNSLECDSIATTSHLKRDGSAIEVEVHWNDVNLDGKEIRISLINDVTEKHERSLQLQQANAVLTTLIESAPIGVVMIDNQGTVEIWNAHAETIFGWPSEEVIGKRLPFIPKHKNNEFRKNLREAFTSKENLQLELERVDNYGETVYLREFVTPIIGSNEVVENVLLLIEDITDATLVQKALVDSEIKYRSLVEASNDLILKTNLRGVITFTNQAANDVLGYSPSEMIGEYALKFVQKVSKEYWYNTFLALSRGENFRNVDLQLQNKKGETVSVNATFQSTKNEDGEVIGFSFYALDISDRIKYQSHLETMLKEKEILIKEIHHRVKNNLAVVSGLLSLQATALNSESAKKAFAESQARIQSIATIHEKLYQNELFTSIEIKGYLEQLANDICNTYRNPNKNVSTKVVGDSIQLNVNQAVPFGIMANEMLINAHKYAFENRTEGEIQISIRSFDDGRVTFMVKDNGVGLPDNFEQNDGTSLGMILIRSLSAQLDADLDITNNKGAQFAITFTPDK